MIDSIKTGRFEVRNKCGTMGYYIDGGRVEYSDLEVTSPERITFDVLQEMYDRENEDNGHKWDDKA